MKKRKRDDMDDFLKKVNVVSQDEAEQADVVICMPDSGPRYFTDDVRALCASCGIPIKYRPHVPKRPMKVCVNCAMLMLDEEQASKRLDA